MVAAPNLHGRIALCRAPCKRLAWLLPWLFLAPALTIYVVVVVYPMAYSAYLSFFKWDGVSPTKQFVGLQNYLTLLLNDPVFWIALRNNAIWLVASLSPPNQHRLRVGRAFEPKVPSSHIFRSVFYFPAILSLAIVGLIWNWIYLPDIGLINQILGALGLTGLQHNWLSDPNFALYAVMLAATWNATGLPMLLYLAGLQTINPEVLEAAQVDGAGPVRRFFSITFPLLRETTLIVLAITAINSLKVYDIIYAMTYGGPANQTQVLSTLDVLHDIQLQFGWARNGHRRHSFPADANIRHPVRADNGKELMSSASISMRERRERTLLVFFYVALSLAAVIWFAPIIMLVFTALKSAGDFAIHGALAIPTSIAWSNFSDAWDTGVKDYFWNSVIIASIKVPLGVVIEAMAAFALTHIPFRWANKMFILILLGLIVPIQMALVPLTIIMNALNLIDTRTGLTLLYLGFGVPFGVLIMRGFFRTIPTELIEAAKIDGCSYWRIFFQIALPLALPAVLSLCILDGVATWNEFILAQIFLRSDELRTLPLGLVNFSTQFSTEYNQLAAAVLISLVPVIIVFLFFQRYFVSGMAGAVK